MVAEVVAGLVAVLLREALVVMLARWPMGLVTQLRIPAVFPAINALPAPIMTARSVINGAGFRLYL